MSSDGTTVDAEAAQLPEHFDLGSENIAAQRRAELVRLFPEVVTEGSKVDFEQLKRALGEQVDVGKERFSFTWPGKAACLKVIQTPSTGTLLPFPDEGVNFNSTENLIVEGDNLEVLKLLQKSYLGKVKMIYIDPPYNTGGDFIYPDNYTESLQTYLEYTGQIDAQGKKFSTNADTDGRFHSTWLNMMYPRLYLARNLLRDDGLIFASIDDNEVASLRQLLNEVFGEANFVAQLVWQRKTGAGARSKGYIVLHEYVLCYAKLKNEDWDLTAPMSDKTKAFYTKVDQYFDQLGPYATWPLDTTSMDERANLRFPIIHEGHEIWPKKQWLWSRDRVEKAQAEKKLVFNFNKAEGTWSVRFKGYLNDADGAERAGKPTTVIQGIYTQEGTKDFAQLFDRDLFPFPKPVALIKTLLNVRVTPESVAKGPDIVLDFFAGSGTTAQAVLDLDEEDNGHRRFILVQLPEPTEREDFRTIADICKERVRRVIGKLNADDSTKLSLKGARDVDRGFRVFKLSESNFTTWDARRSEGVEELEERLELHVAHVREGRSDDDLLYEILLKSGFPLTTKVQAIEFSGKTVFSVADGALVLCLDRGLTLELIREIAARAPERVVCLDEGFARNDQLKANAVQIFKTKGITSFKTV